jgi:hypothetical protein
MPVYIVGFDVRNASSAADYSGLQNAVSKLERHRLMPWLYLVSVPFTAGALKEYLLNHMADDDRLWISRLPAKARFEFAYQTMGGTSSWLKKHGRVDLPVSPEGPGLASEDPGRSASENVAFKPIEAPKAHRHTVVHAANS